MINFEVLKVPTPEITKDHWNNSMSEIQTHFSGNVGLGTDNAEAKLHVQGIGGGNVDLLVNGRIKSDNVSGGLWVGDDRFIGGHSTNKVGFYSNKNWRLTVQNNGNVGIGTTTPTSLLSLGTSLSTLKLALYQNSDGTSYYGMGITSGRFSLNIGNPQARYSFMDRAGSGAKEILTIRGSGNTGIGTSSPSYKLHVKGDIYADGGWLRVSGKRGIYFESYKGGFYMTDTTWIRTYGSKNFYHNKGIMRTDGELHVGSGGNRFTVKTNGNVGVGVSNPSEKLHVNGAIKAKLRYIGDKKNVQYNTSTGEIGYDNSTRRDKRNITPLADDFRKVLQLQPRTYTRPFDQDSWEIGYIAEEAKSLGLKNLLFYDENNDVDGVNYRKLCLYMMEILRDHESKLNPDSPYLKKYVEDDLTKPTAKSNLKTIKHYLDFYRISYNNKDVKKELLKKIETMD